MRLKGEWMTNAGVFNAAVFLMSFLFLAVTSALSQPRQSDLQISDDVLKRTVKAYRPVAQIQTDLENELQAAQDQEERVRLQHQANARMVRAIDSAGISYETYTDVLKQVSREKELAERFRKLLEEK
ncbi:MAG: DUF4168 domain-containing protein [Fibrobacterota bacterium]